ncbi:MAG: DUF4010 domain-containing protein [Candidatus Micrarchaeota archaeon]|nr:DUF4010 domain-containing protein [Candidatus Micrarchaeota archaeon]
MIINTYESIARLIIATGIGTLIGLERKRTSAEETELKIFSFSSLFGCICAMAILYEIPLGEFFPIIGFIFMIFFSHNSLKIAQEKKAKLDRITYYIMPILFLLGLMTGSGLVWEAASATFLIIATLAIGKKLEKTMEILTDEEIGELIQIGIILFILFPLLPPKPIEIDGIQLDLFLVFAFFLIVTLLNLFAFLAYRIFRRESSSVTGFIGGVINSTYSIYQLNKSKDGITSEGVIAAMLGSILRNTILVVIVMNEIIDKVLPLFLLIAGMFLVLVIKERAKQKKRYRIEKPITVINSVYATVFLTIAIALFQLSAKYFPQYLPIVSFLASTISSGYTMLSLGSVYLTITEKELLLSIATAIIGSFLTSVLAAYVLNKEIGKKTFRYSLLATLILLVYLLIVQAF